MSRPAIAFLFCLAATLIPPGVFAARRDVVVMKNGDRVTGEIKKLDHGILYIDLPYVDGETVALDWLQVERLESTADFRVELQEGKKLTGKIESKGDSGQESSNLVILAEDEKVSVPAGTVVSLETQSPNFWKQLKGSIDFGLGYTSGNSQTQGSFAGNAEYASVKWYNNAALKINISGQSGAEKTRRYQLGDLFARRLQDNDFIFASGDALSSTQQSLDARVVLGGGYGRYFIRNNRTEFSWLAGVVGTYEHYSPGISPSIAQENAEGSLGLRFSTFRLNRSTISAEFRTFPSITDPGRVRSDLNSGITLKLVHDLHFRVAVWDTFDSRPPVNAKKNELGLDTSFGWTF